MLNSYRWCRCSMTRISFDFLWWCLRNFGSIFEFAELLWHALVDFLVEFRWTCDGFSKDRLSIVVALGWTTWTTHPLDIHQFIDNIINECIDRFALKRYLGASGLQIRFLVSLCMHWPQAHPEEDGERRPAFGGLLLAVRPFLPRVETRAVGWFCIMPDNFLLLGVNCFEVNY